MKNVLLVSCLAICLSACSTLKNVLLEPTSLETVNAIKSILDNSATKAVATLQMLNQGEDSLPDELKPVLQTLKKLGLEDQIGDIQKAITTASEVAATESEGIFKDAIAEVKFTDAVSLVTGGDDAATKVLKGIMYTTVKKRYSERLDSELGKHDVIKYWPMATSAYNLFAKEDVEADLSDFLSERAVDAVFLGMANQEKIIRGDYTKLGDAVVTKVFDYYTKNK